MTYISKYSNKDFPEKKAMFILSFEIFSSGGKFFIRLLIVFSLSESSGIVSDLFIRNKQVLINCGLRFGNTFFYHFYIFLSY